MTSFPSSLAPSRVPVLLSHLEQKDAALYWHGRRVGFLARWLGENLGLSEADLNLLETSAHLHDIGKLFIPSFLVHKRSPLNAQEYQILRRHVLLGARLLNRSDDTARLAPVARFHHERWDGKGYPARLHGQDIPLLARITSVADVYDAMTSNRPGGNQGHEKAVMEIVQCRGSQLWPEAVDAFLRIESRCWEEMAS